MSSELECKECKAHSGMEEALKNIKKWQETVTATLTHIVTAKSAWAFFVVFLSVCLAVVGFLWHGQIAIWNNVNLNHKETMSLINSVDKKVDLIDYKVQKHLEEWPSAKKGNKE
jgi:hypothetical protein